MPDEQNPITEENPVPSSSQEPTEPDLENTADLGDSRPSVLVEELGADGGDLKGVGYDNIPSFAEGYGGAMPPPEDSIPTETEKEKTPVVEQAHYGAGTQENQAEIPSVEFE